MLRYSEVIGLPAISAESGWKLGTIKDIVFSSFSRSAVAYLLEKGSYALRGSVVLPEDVLNLGNDALIVRSAVCLKDFKKFRKTSEMKERVQLRGLRVYTRDGNDIGVVYDVLFDCNTGKIEGVQITDGLIQDIWRGRIILPMLGKIEIGKENILVEEEAVEEIVNSGGGLLKRLQKV